MDELLSITGHLEKDQILLQQFLEKNKKTFSFPYLYENEVGQKVWNVLFTNINNLSCISMQQVCLAVVRTLSRDKQLLNFVVSSEDIESLLKLSGLHNGEFCCNLSDDCLLEVLKCLCNLIFNNAFAQAYCAKNAAVCNLFVRLRTYSDPSKSYEIKYFCMKLLFVMTALCGEICPKILMECQGLLHLTEELELIVKEATKLDEASVVLSDDQISLACEILKVLFNIFIHSSFSTHTDYNKESHYQQLLAILHVFLLCEARSRDKFQDLQKQLVNLLTSIPNNLYSELLTPKKNNFYMSKSIEYMGINVSTIYILINFLSTQLEFAQNIQMLHEELSPILTVLLKSAHANSLMRKYIKRIILPPLKDVTNRPEVGSSLRNQLCRLLTTPVTTVRDLVAELLFVLCKENVGRMIKYTGYGNAAGMFANRGLLAGKQATGDNEYSSDSDSDTEEYLAAVPNINPVTGRFEANLPNSTAYVSEEQKEYEAMELVKLIDQLSKGGLIRPCRIGADGKPEPVDHVLQLQDELSKDSSNLCRK